MNKHEKLRLKILGGDSDANISFRDLCRLLTRMGFAERVRGGHHLFRKAGVEELINLQQEGRTAKPYQVRQVRNVILNYGMSAE